MGDRLSIYRHILENIRPGEPGLGEEGDLLPDDEIVRGGKEIRWAPGALDGVFGHHFGSNEAAEVANKILESFRGLSKKATDERARVTLLAVSRTVLSGLCGPIAGGCSC